MMKFLNKMLFATAILTTVSVSAIAAPPGFKDRLVFVGSSNANDQVELNYYLENGGSIVKFQAIARSNSSNVCAYVHVVYPADLRPWTKDMRKKE